MAISFSAAGTVHMSSGATAYTIDYPATVNAGDFLLLLGTSSTAWNRGGSYAPDGWHRFPAFDGPYTIIDTMMFWRIADGTEGGGSVTMLAIGSNEYHGGVIVAYAGVDPAHPFDVAPDFALHGHAGTTSAGTNADAHDAITTVTDGAYVVTMWLGAAACVTAEAVPSGFTERHFVSGGSYQYFQSFIADVAAPSAGVVTPGAAAMTLTAGAVFAAFTFALRPVTADTATPFMRSRGDSLRLAGSAASIDVPYPDDFDAGDVLLLVTQITLPNSSPKWSTPSGWTRLEDIDGVYTDGVNREVMIAYKVATGSETGTLTVSTSATINEFWHGNMFAFGNVGDAVLDVTPTGSHVVDGVVSTTNALAPADITTATDNALVVVIGTFSGNGTIKNPRSPAAFLGLFASTGTYSTYSQAVMYARPVPSAGAVSIAAPPAISSSGHYGSFATLAFTPAEAPPAATVQGVELTIELGFGFSVLDNPITWVDVSDRVRGFSFTRGRQFELDRVEAGTGSVTLDNRDGELTPGNTASAWYPDVRSSTPIRIRAEYDSTTYGLFLGLIEDIPMTFPGRKDSIVEVPFSDAMKLLATARTRPQFAVLVAALEPRAFWRFSDLTDSGPEGDHTLTAAGGPTSGAAGAWVGDLAYSFDGTDDKVTAADGAADLDITGDFTAVIVMDGTNIPLSSGGWLLERNDGSDHAPYMIFIDEDQSIVRWKSGSPSAPVFTDATVPWSDVGNGAGLADGWQVLAWVRDGNVVSHYSDGVLRGSVTVPPDAIIDIVSASAGTVIGAGDSTFTEVDISEVVLWDRVLTPAEIAGLASALGDSFPVERTDERIDRLLTIAGVPSAGIDLEVGIASMSASSSGSELPILDEIGKATDTEAGVLFIDRDGVARFHDRHYRVEDSAALSGTFGPSDLTIFDLEAGVYDALIFNEVSVTPGDSGAAVIVTDAASIEKHGSRSRQLTIYPSDAGIAAQHAAYILSIYAENAVRVPRLSLALGKDLDLWAVVLGAELGDRFRVIKTLEGDDLDQEVFLEAITHTVLADKTWSVSWDLSPATAQAAFWILGTSTLGETTILNL